MTLIKGISIIPPASNRHLRILIIRFSSIGDIVLTTPLIRSIKKKYPNALIDYLTLDEYSSILKYNPYIDRLILINRDEGYAGLIKGVAKLRDNGYTHILDLHRSLRSLIFRRFIKAVAKQALKKRYIKRLLLINAGINLYNKPYSIINRYFDVARLLDISLEGKTEIWIDNDKLANALVGISIKLRNNLSQNPDITSSIIRIEKGVIQRDREMIVSIMPFAKWNTKEWGDSKFIELGCRISEKKGSRIFVLGGERDKLRSEKIATGIGHKAISLAGKLSLLETAMALSISDCLITNDTGVMHIGGSVSIPVIAIFGSTTEELGFFPYNMEDDVIQISLNCRPCSAKGRLACPKEHFRCMNDITVDMVYSAMIKHM
ncbi:MAG: glycosyltransferase family 9 protein [Spirochaetota bacterium]|nr:glycosyltransferase family 9 protein [Spirochaetota bacterium]